jgi:glutathione-regulated potassium-efflux system ancillary protein KefF
MICVIHAHPYLSRSRTNRALAAALGALPDVGLRSLYDLYPDFDIDVPAEQRALAQARLVVWMHPVYWYSVPALLKHWFDKVLAFGWAYGDDGFALRGKHCLWVPTTGGGEQTYRVGALHAFPFASFAPAIEQTARYCGMHWEPPHVVYRADALDDAELSAQADALCRRVAPWRAPSTPAAFEAARR